MFNLIKRMMPRFELVIYRKAWTWDRMVTYDPFKVIDRANEAIIQTGVHHATGLVYWPWKAEPSRIFKKMGGSPNGELPEWVVSRRLRRPVRSREVNTRLLKCSDCGEQARVSVVEYEHGTGKKIAWFWCGECGVGA